MRAHQVRSRKTEGVEGSEYEILSEWNYNKRNKTSLITLCTTLFKYLKLKSSNYYKKNFSEKSMKTLFLFLFTTGWGRTALERALRFRGRSLGSQPEPKLYGLGAGRLPSPNRALPMHRGISISSIPQYLTGVGFYPMPRKHKNNFENIILKNFIFIKHI